MGENEALPVLGSQEASPDLALSSLKSQAPLSLPLSLPICFLELGSLGVSGTGGGALLALASGGLSLQRFIRHTSWPGESGSPVARTGMWIPI